jgi:hypothetical protein
MPSREALQKVADITADEFQTAFERALAKSGGIKIDFGNVDLSAMTEPLERITEELTEINRKIANSTKKSVDDIEKSIKRLNGIKPKKINAKVTVDGVEKETTKEVKENNGDLEEVAIQKIEEKTESIDEIPYLDDDDEEEKQDMDLSDEELDFFQMAQESEEEYQENEDDIESDDDIDLNAIADNSIDSNFEEIINTKSKPNPQTIALDDKTNINADVLKTQNEKENLPIFKNEEKPKEAFAIYSVGNVITHKKYGKGTVVKTIKYENRQLLQIEFEEAGKKLLDPTVADIKLEQ